MRSTAAPYTESRLTRSVANERVGFPVVEHYLSSQTTEEPGEKIAPSLVAEKDPCAYDAHRQILNNDLHFSILCSGPNRAANGGLKNKII